MSWGAGIEAKDANRLNKLIKNVGSVVGSGLVTLEEVVEDRLLVKLLEIITPSTKLWTSLRAASAAGSINLLPKGTAREVIPAWCHQTIQHSHNKTHTSFIVL